MNKKILFLVGTKLNIDYINTIRYFISFFIKQEKTITKKEWLIRNVKYIYASSPEEAINKYNKYFFCHYKTLKGWRDWYDCSPNITLYSIGDPKFKITEQEIIILQSDCNPKNIKILKEDMLACDFRDWWHYHCDDITEVLNND